MRAIITLPKKSNIY